MRNGNTVNSEFLDRRDLGSYRTYEEWKLSLTFAVSTILLHRSYRTYEEWKHPSFAVG